MSTTFGPGFHAAPGKAVDASAYDRWRKKIVSGCKAANMLLQSNFIIKQRPMMCNRRQLSLGIFAGAILGISSPSGPTPTFADDNLLEPDGSAAAVIRRSGHAPAFLEAVAAAGLQDLLISEGGLTFFVPLVQEFTRSPSAQSRDRRSLWRDFVKSHVVRGIHSFVDLTGKIVLFRTLAGSTLVLDAISQPPLANRIIRVDLVNQNYGLTKVALHWLAEPLVSPPGS